MKISCSSLAWSNVSWQAALEQIKKLGFDYVDLAMFEGWTHVSPSQLIDPEGHAAEITDLCGQLGVEPIAIHANFAPPGMRPFPGLTSPDAEARKTVLAHFDRVLRCAAAAKVPLVNVQPGKLIEGAPRKTCLENAVALLRQMESAARRRGVALSFENHTGSIGERPDDCLAILEAVPGLLLDYDFSHLVANSIRPGETLPLMKYVAHVGVRNAKPGSYNEPVRGETLDYPLETFLDVLRRAEASAYVSIEYYQPEMQEHVPQLKAILERCGLKAQG